MPSQVSGENEKEIRALIEEASNKRAQASSLEKQAADLPEVQHSLELSLGRLAKATEYVRDLQDKIEMLDLKINDHQKSKEANQANIA